jgi:3-hydroxyisobutyrate dehydrogenase-like beta-hydroxyacid dehydrogenase
VTIRKVGFAGLGLMGSRMAQSLRRRGFEVVVWNRSRKRADELKADSIEVAGTPRELAQRVEAFCTCVADPAALREVAFGEHGLFAGAREGQLFIDFSTVSVETSLELEAESQRRGLGFVEAPVTGSKMGAQNGTLVMMVGAAAEVLERARPVLLGVGEKIIHCGGVGAGTHVKLAGNGLIAAMLQAFSEGMLAVRKAGVDPLKYLEVVQASGFRSPYFDFKGKALMERNFETHFSIDLMFKDLSLMLENAGKLKVPTPMAAASRELYQLARASGKGEQDITAVITVLEELTGTKISG